MRLNAANRIYGPKDPSLVLGLDDIDRPTSGFSPVSTDGGSSQLGNEIRIILPPKSVAIELIESVWDHACVLFRFYHRPSFIRDLDLLYETDPDDYTTKQYKILPLVYSVMAVGVLFSMDRSEELGFKDASEGYKYFVAARKLIDIADARDTYAIQSIVMMILFLQCSARLSTCYSYIGVALRSTLRAGLHRKVAYNFNPIELETRKRLFWTVRKMDIYVNAMLGLPRSISEEDFDQELPVEIDDENITEEGYFEQKPGKLSSAGIANAHTRLITVMSHIMKNIYPVNPDAGHPDEVNSNGNQHVRNYRFNATHSKVEEMERELQQWLQSLPPQLTPGTNPAPEYLKANRLLNLAYCHVQIVLYRPFIHYSSPRYSVGHTDHKARLWAAKCITVSRRVMYIAHDLVSRKLLNGAYWFSIYTMFFSVACLVFYVHENINAEDAIAIRKDAELGKNALNLLKDSSMSAQRTYNLLNSLFEQLNRRTSRISPNTAASVSKVENSTHTTYEMFADSDQLPSELPSVPDVPNNLSANIPIDLPSAPLTVPSITPGPSVAPSVASIAPSLSSRQTTPFQNNGLPNDIKPIDFPSLYESPQVPEVVPSEHSSSSESPQLYVPGMMDQFDMQIFGRFLPPYMMQQQPNQQTSQSMSNNPAPQLQPQPQLQQVNVNTNPSFDGSYIGSNNDGRQLNPQMNQTLNVPVVDSIPESFIKIDDGRHISLSEFSPGNAWDELVAEHSELSGLNSLMAND